MHGLNLIPPLGVSLGRMGAVSGGSVGSAYCNKCSVQRGRRGAGPLRVRLRLTVLTRRGRRVYVGETGYAVACTALTLGSPSGGAGSEAD